MHFLCQSTYLFFSGVECPRHNRLSYIKCLAISLMAYGGEGVGQDGGRGPGAHLCVQAYALDERLIPSQLAGDRSKAVLWRLWRSEAAAWPLHCSALCGGEVR